MIGCAQWEALKNDSANDANNVPLPAGALDQLVREYEDYKIQQRNTGNADRDTAVVVRFRLAQRIVHESAEVFSRIGGISSAHAPALTILRIAAEDTVARLHFEFEAVQQQGKALEKAARPEALDPQHRRWHVLFPEYEQFRKLWKEQLLDAATPSRKLSAFYTWLQADRARIATADQAGETPYLDQERRKRKRILIENGLVKRPDKAQQWMPYSSPRSGSIFVMLTDKNIYTSKADWKHQDAKPPNAMMKHHSGLAGGETILAAGSWTIVAGKITEITQQSGHYHPRLKEILALLKELDTKNVNLDAIELRVYKYSNDPRCETPDSLSMLPDLWTVPDGAGNFLRTDGAFSKVPGAKKSDAGKAAPPPAPQGGRYKERVVLDQKPQPGGYEERVVLDQKPPGAVNQPMPQQSPYIMPRTKL